MYLLDKETVFRFGLRKVDGKYFPVKIEDETQIKEGQIVFEAKSYTTKDVITFNGLTDDLKKLEFIKNRTSCNVSLDNMLPIILFSVNYYVMAESVMSGEDERLFM